MLGVGGARYGACGVVSTPGLSVENVWPAVDDHGVPKRSCLAPISTRRVRPLCHHRALEIDASRSPLMPLIPPPSPWMYLP